MDNSITISEFFAVISLYILINALFWRDWKLVFFAQFILLPIFATLGFLIYEPLGQKFEQYPDWTIWLPCLISVLFVSLLKFLREWIGPILDPPVDAQNYGQVFMARAVRFEKEAKLILGAIFILIIGAAVVFFKADDFVGDDYKAIYRHVRKEVPTEYDFKPIILLIGIRIGDIAVASFLTYMLVRIYRYNLRMSSFYYSRKDAHVLMNESRYSQVEMRLLPILLDANFDFGGDHPSLVDSFAKLVNALVPGKKEEPGIAPTPTASTPTSTEVSRTPAEGLPSTGADLPRTGM